MLEVKNIKSVLKRAMITRNIKIRKLWDALVQTKRRIGEIEKLEDKMVQFLITDMFIYLVDYV